MRLGNLSIKSKLLILMVIPLLGLIYFCIADVRRAAHDAASAELVGHLAKVSAANSLLVHELQKERGASAGYLGSNGNEFGSVLQRQYRETRTAIDNWNSLTASIDASEIPDQISRALSQVNTRLADLERVRSGVQSQSMNSGEAIGFYTETNSILLDVSAKAADLSVDADLTQALLAYYSFLQGKERAGIERAVMSQVFSQDRFNSVQRVKFVTLVAEQNTFFKQFEVNADEASLAFYSSELKKNAIDQVENYRDIAIEKIGAGRFGVASDQWFEVATQRINILKTIEDYLSKALLDLSVIKVSESRASLMFFIIFSSILVLVTSLVGYLIISGLSKQVEALTSVMIDSARDKDLTLRAGSYSRDELGKAAYNLNLMFDQFSTALDEIGKSSIQLASAAEETSSTVEENAQSLDKQNEQTQMVGTAVEQMSATTQEVATNISLAAEAAQKAENIAVDSRNTVERNVERIQELTSEVRKVGGIINELHESSSSIVNVVEVIKSVAEQTNLLALNAAIEAARAGEQGRGFAVVADEVRTLAQRTQSSTTEIETIISNFKSLSESAFKAIQQGSESAEKTASQSGELIEALDLIGNSVKTISAMATEVATAAEQQVSTTHEIAQNMGTISEMTQATSTGSRQISEVSQEQARLASDLQGISTAFKT